MDYIKNNINTDKLRDVLIALFEKRKNKTLEIKTVFNLNDTFRELEQYPSVSAVREFFETSLSDRNYQGKLFSGLENQNFKTINDETVLQKKNFNICEKQDLINKYYTKSDLHLIVDRQQKLFNNEYIFVDKLPEIGEKNKCYLISSEDVENTYDKYIWIGKWLFIGKTNESFTNYYNNHEVDNLLDKVQGKLVSGVNIANINDEDIFENENITIQEIQQLDWKAPEKIDNGEWNSAYIKNKVSLPTKVSDLLDNEDYVKKDDMPYSTYPPRKEYTQMVNFTLNNLIQFEIEQMQNPVEDYLLEDKKLYLEPCQNPTKDRKFNKFLFFKEKQKTAYYTPEQLKSKYSFGGYLFTYNITEVEFKIEQLVDKLPNKNLSSNDFTDEYKENLENNLMDKHLENINKKIHPSTAENSFAKKQHKHTESVVEINRDFIEDLSNKSKKNDDVNVLDDYMYVCVASTKKYIDEQIEKIMGE